MRIGLLAASMSLAASVEAHAVEEALEVVVTADPFARWDDTRWRIDMQMGLPYPVVLYAEFNHELQVVAVDLRAVIACDLGPRLNRKLQEVSCFVEDAALSAAPWLRRLPPHAQEVLDETVDRLIGQGFTMQVTADGRVMNLGLVDEPQSNRRVNILYENLRQLLKRTMVGFHLRSPEKYVVGREWVERNSELFNLPVFRFAPLMSVVFAPPSGGSDYSGFGPESSGLRTPLGGEMTLPNLAFDPSGVALSAADRVATGRHPIELLQAPATLSRSTVVHRMDAYKGRYVVQSTGEGTVDVGDEQSLFFLGELTAASVFSAADGWMTERVWTLQLMPSGSSLYAEGVAGWPYWQIGRLVMLGADEVSEVGVSALVSPPHASRGQLAPWPAMP
jgi:hypothetical protein